MANIKSQKRMAAEILKCGIYRIKIKSVQEAEEALTREDVRNLIRKGIISKVQKRGSSRAAARKILTQKKKGRRKGMGKRKGKLYAGESKKRKWTKTIKTMRSLLKELKENGRIERKDYRNMYLRIKSGMFRNRNHILLYLKEHDLLKQAEPVKKQEAGKKAKPSTKHLKHNK